MSAPGSPKPAERSSQSSRRSKNLSLQKSHSITSHDNSKGFGSSLPDEVGSPQVTMSSKKAPQVDVGDVLDETVGDWDEIDNYKREAMNFPPSKSTGSALTLERMDFVRKTVERMKTGLDSKEQKSLSKSFSKATISGDLTVGEENDVSYANDVGVDGREIMEEIFVQCCRTSAADLRLLELLGGDKEDQLFKDQQKIVDYFKHKNSVMQGDFSKMQDMFLADDDALGELVRPVGVVSTPQTPKKAAKMAAALTRDPTEDLQDMAERPDSQSDDDREALSQRQNLVTSPESPSSPSGRRGSLVASCPFLHPRRKSQVAIADVDGNGSQSKGKFRRQQSAVTAKSDPSPAKSDEDKGAATKMSGAKKVQAGKKKSQKNTDRVLPLLPGIKKKNETT